MASWGTSYRGDLFPIFRNRRFIGYLGNKLRSRLREGGGMDAVAEVVDVFEFAEVAEKNKDVTKAV